MKKIIFSRVDEKESKLLKEVCRLRGESISSFVRRSIRKELAGLSYLPEDQKRALGLGIDYEHRK